MVLNVVGSNPINHPNKESANNATLFIFYIQSSIMYMYDLDFLLNFLEVRL